MFKKAYKFEDQRGAPLSGATTKPIAPRPVGAAPAMTLSGQADNFVPTTQYPVVSRKDVYIPSSQQRELLEQAKKNSTLGEKRSIMSDGGAKNEQTEIFKGENPARPVQQGSGSRTSSGDIFGEEGYRGLSEEEIDNYVQQVNKYFDDLDNWNETGGGVTVTPKTPVPIVPAARKSYAYEDLANPEHIHHNEFRRAETGYDLYNEFKNDPRWTSKFPKEYLEEQLAVLRGERVFGKFGNEIKLDPEIEKRLTQHAAKLNESSGTELESLGISDAAGNAYNADNAVLSSDDIHRLIVEAPKTKKELHDLARTYRESIKEADVPANKYLRDGYVYSNDSHVVKMHKDLLKVLDEVAPEKIAYALNIPVSRTQRAIDEIIAGKSGGVNGKKIRDHIAAPFNYGETVENTITEFDNIVLPKTEYEINKLKKIYSPKNQYS
jgi:hypothetical protein